MDSQHIPVTVNVPASLVDEGTAERATRLLILDAVRAGRLTWRAAARELDLAPAAFLDLARLHGVPVVRVDEDELRQDFSTLDCLLRDRKDG